MRKIIGIMLCVFAISFSTFAQEENYTIADSVVEKAFANAKEVNPMFQTLKDSNDWQVIESILLVDKNRFDIVYAGWAKKFVCCSSLVCCVGLLHLTPTTEPIEINLFGIENNLKDERVDDRFFISQ